MNDLLVDSPFLDLHFFEALEYSKSIGGVTGWKSFPIVATKDKEVVGFIPIFLKSHSYGEYVFDWSWAEAFESHGLSYYPKMISAAQALYRGQALVCKDPEIKKHLIEAGEEETDHLVWCKKRLDELDGKGSILNPIWYANT